MHLKGSTDPFFQKINSYRDRLSPIPYDLGGRKAKAMATEMCRGSKPLTDLVEGGNFDFCPQLR